MTRNLDDLKLERPPTYSSIDPAGRSSYQGLETVAQQADPYELEIHVPFSGSSSLHIKHNDNTLYHLGHHHALDIPDMILHAGYDSHGPQLALASFIPDSKDLKIYIGGLKAPTTDDWDIARCAGGGTFKHSRHRFETRSNDTAGKKVKYFWEKTSDRKLGASRWSPRDYKLVRESDDEVVAVYVEHHLGSGTVKGAIRFREKMNDFAEMASMMVLLCLLEMSRRHMKAIANAFPSTNGY